MLDGQVKSCGRVFDILELFGALRRPLRLKEIAAALGFPTSSAAALAKSMAARGYLSYDPDARTYLPTARLALLLGWVPGNAFEQVAVLAAMRQVRIATQELVVLGIEQDLHLEYIGTMRSSGGAQLYAAPGTRRALVATAGSLLLQNRRRADAIMIYRRSVERGLVDPKRLSESEFLGRLKAQAGEPICHTRARDIGTQTAHWDGAMIYALLPVPEGHRPLVVGVGGTAERIEAKRDLIVSALRECRRQLQAHIERA